MEPLDKTGLYYRTGPEDYSPSNVAAAFAKALGRTVEVVQIQEDKWESYLEEQGFSKKAAMSMANMTRITLKQDYELPENPERGSVTLDKYISDLTTENRK
jgi:uncharacterized protein YbjT (DUF2867 family)